MLPPLVLSALAIRAPTLAGGANAQQLNINMKQILVTDGTDSFYNTRTVFQSLHTHGDFQKITAHSSSVANAKKMLLSREARYSGLIDVLEFSEQPLEETFKGSDVWLAMNADEAALPAQIESAKTAGVQRIFLMFASDGPTNTIVNVDSLKSCLDGSGCEYTVMRVGKLEAKASGGGGLKLLDIDEEECGELSRDDVFRFMTEAMTLSEANGRIFSLCPSPDASQLKEMRQAGCDRREEAQALLSGVIVEKLESEDDASSDDSATTGAAAAESGKSEEEIAKEREEEISMLMERARKRGIEMEKKRKEEEEAKIKAREERAMYFRSKSYEGDDEEEDPGADKGESGDQGDDDDSPPEPPASDTGSDDPPPDSSGGGDDEPPLALA